MPRCSWQSLKCSKVCGHRHAKSLFVTLHSQNWLELEGTSRRNEPPRIHNFETRVYRHSRRTVLDVPGDEAEPPFGPSGSGKSPCIKFEARDTLNPKP